MAIHPSFFNTNFSLFLISFILILSAFPTRPYDQSPFLIKILFPKNARFD